MRFEFGVRLLRSCIFVFFFFFLWQSLYRYIAVWKLANAVNAKNACCAKDMGKMAPTVHGVPCRAWDLIFLGEYIFLQRSYVQG